MNATPQGSTDRLISQRELCDRLSVKRITVWRWVKRGLFPAPIQIGGHTIRWRDSEVSAWMASQPPADQAAA